MVKDKKRPVVYAFIDSQNLNLGVSNDVIHKGKKIYSGWELDFKKFRQYLKDKHKVETAFLFIGNMPGRESLYAYLQRIGYIVVLKPTTSFKDTDGRIRVKGNVDTDLVLYASAKEIENYDKAVIVSGDGDFLSLCEHLEGVQKLGALVVPNKHRYSNLLSKFVDYMDYVSVNKKKLEKDKRQKETGIT